MQEAGRRPLDASHAAGTHGSKRALGFERVYRLDRAHPHTYQRQSAHENSPHGRVLKTSTGREIRAVFD